MQIPSELHQFEHHAGYIIATGKQEAIIYRAFQGVIEEIDRLEAEAPPTDRKPGVVKMRGQGREIHSGVALEQPQGKQEMKAVRNFLKDFSEEVKKELSWEEEEVYLFVPDYMENAVLELIPENTRSRIRQIYHGNHLKDHPLDLVRRIDKDLKDKKVTPTDPEAAKILKRGEKDQ